MPASPSPLRLTALLVLLASGLATAADPASFVAFESEPVRPLALSPDRSRLFAINTPDGKLEILDVTAAGLAHVESVPVGLEPVAVAVRNADEVWVVNHLSDSISVVDVGQQPARVVRTLLVGDEPRDVVFAGPAHGRAFVTTAHRGQNSPVDTRFPAGGTGRADVWVFDAAHPGASLGGNPLAIVELFGDTPRALAATPDGSTVYAAVLHSGNQTTTISRGAVCVGGLNASCEIDGVAMPGGLPLPNVSADGVPQPHVGLIARFDPASESWFDAIGRDWRAAVRIALPDLDVFAIDALASPPVATASYPHVGTAIFNLAVNPVSGRVYASNTEARNDRRFAGLGLFGGPTVRGRLHESRITVIGPGVQPRHLNKHIDYDVVPSPPDVAPRSLAQPLEMAVTADGATLYVAAFGSDKVGVFSTTALENDSFVPDASQQIAVPNGPCGLVLDEPRQRLYVATRFDDAIRIVDTATRTVTATVPLYDPEPASLSAGRRFLYDATLTSSNGEASCASCHVFGDTDHLAWDLGNPDATIVWNPSPSKFVPAEINGFSPLKGPMTTQTFRGIGTGGPMHWRGDRSGAFDDGGSASDETAAFRQFNEAFVGLLGRAAPLAAADMEAFARFAVQIAPPPNPNRPLDHSRTPAQQTGADGFFAPGGECSGCHVVDVAQGFLGTDGFITQSDSARTQIFKIPHLDNLYQKIGLFAQGAPFNYGDLSFTGPQIRGFGYLHDGSQGFPPTISDDTLEFLMAFDTRFAPIVGQQLTLTSSNAATVGPRLDLMIARAALGECDLIAHGAQDGSPRGWLREADGLYRSDRSTEARLDDAALRAQARTAGAERTYLCAPPGTGPRLALDRDEDGALDADERDAGSDPADPASLPTGCTPLVAFGAASLRVGRAGPPAGDETVSFRGTTALAAFAGGVPATDGVTVTVADTSGQPLWTRTVPGGAAWRTTPSGWTFRDPTGTIAGGVRKIVLSRGRSVARISLAGRALSFDLPTVLAPLRLSIRLGAGPGCTQVAFGVPGGGGPSCRLQGGGATLSCR